MAKSKVSAPISVFVPPVQARPLSRSYIAIVSGIYWVETGAVAKPHVQKTYREAFRLTEGQKASALSFIKVNLLEQRLKAKHTDYLQFYTHHMEALYNEQDPTSYDGIPYHWMSLPQLHALIAQARLPIPVDQIKAISELRIMVRMYFDSPQNTTGLADYIKSVLSRQAKASFTDMSHVDQEDSQVILEQYDSVLKRAQKVRSSQEHEVLTRAEDTVDQSGVEDLFQEA